MEQALVKESVRQQRFWEVMQVQERPQGSKKAPGRAEVGRQQEMSRGALETQRREHDGKAFGSKRVIYDATYSC